ncbi:MAG: MutS-related protein, partial [Spirochaetota bacterium]
VPAAEARISSVDYLATHFPRGEHSATELGRFGEEIARLSAMFDTLSAESLVLLNESFAATNPAEAVAFGREILRALGEAGTRVLVATHLLELAHSATSLGPFVAMTAEVEPGEEGARRTFRIVPGLPGDTGYAYDLVRRAGMTYEQLSERLRRRGVVSKEHPGE